LVRNEHDKSEAGPCPEIGRRVCCLPEKERISLEAISGDSTDETGGIGNHVFQKDKVARRSGSRAARRREAEPDYGSWWCWSHFFSERLRAEEVRFSMKGNTRISNTTFAVKGKGKQETEDGEAIELEVLNLPL
jgi:hypothetical protein